jgi:hypothetical protein
MEISITATNGSRCHNETHKFRLHSEGEPPTVFVAHSENFLEKLTDAVLTHNLALQAAENAKPIGKRWPHKFVAPALKFNVMVGKRPNGEEDWVWVQNPRTGGAMGVYPNIVGQKQSADALFMWACNAVQMNRDILVLSEGLAKAATEQ